MGLDPISSVLHAFSLCPKPLFNTFKKALGICCVLCCLYELLYAIVYNFRYQQDNSGLYYELRT